MEMYPDYRNMIRDAQSNNDYRVVLYTVPHSFQLVMMCLIPGERIPREVHDQTTQFIQVVSGYGYAYLKLGDRWRRYRLFPNASLIIAPSIEHEIVQYGTAPLRLITTYSPPEHAPWKHNVRQP